MSAMPSITILTGANGAAGAPVARALAAAGHTLVLVHRGREQDAIDALARETGASDLIADTSTSAGVTAAFDAAIDRHGRVDAVVHLPGRSLSGRPLAELTDDEWDAQGAVNLDSAFYVVREAAKRLADDGRVVLLSTSLVAVTTPGYGSYAPFKAAVEHLVKVAAKELGTRGITVNAVAPGPIDSPFVNDALPPEARAHVEGFSPMGRLGQWDEVAPAVAFLASAEANWVSAQTLRVNGAFVG